MQQGQTVGSSVPLSECRHRIVCLFQGAVDAVCALGLQNCLVGRSHGCTTPASVLGLPCISTRDSNAIADTSCQWNLHHQNVLGCYNINWDLLQELKPDLIFSNALSSADKQLALASHQLTERKCRLVYLQSHTVEDIFQNLETIASYCGVEKESAELVTQYRSHWKSVKQKTPQWADGMPHVNAGFLSSVNPLIGAAYWVPEIIGYAGGLSSFGVMGCSRKALTLEDLTQTNPDVILYLNFELHSESLVTKLSQLLTTKEWLNLKAIKANRFFLIDASRFFIDSAPNVISSTELLAEIFHGFDYGHEGKGFVRWQCLINTKLEHNDSITSQGSGFRNKLPGFLTCKSTSANSMHVDDMHEVCGSPSQGYPKYVTNVNQAGKVVIQQKGEIPRCNLREKPDVWDEELVLLDMETEDVLQQEFDGGCAQDRQLCLETKIITPDKVFQVEKTHLMGSTMLAMNWRGDWQMQMIEETSPNAKHREAAQVTLCPVNSNDIGDQQTRNIGLRLARTHDSPTVSPHHLPRQHALGRAASSTIQRSGSFVGGGYRDKQLISKIWAFAESAAEMRSGSSCLKTEQRIHKSVSLPVSRRSYSGRSSMNEICVLPELVEKTNAISANRYEGTPLVESTVHQGLAKESCEYDVKRETMRAVKSFTARKHAEKCPSNIFLKRQLSYSVPSSPKLDILTRVSRHVRDLVFKSLVDLEHLDCLLLSGGLASGILAEAVPLLHTKGFRVGFTVVAGPAATDRVSAAVAAKCKGMQHVVIGEGEKGFAVFLLAKELSFVVEKLKTFDPFQVRNMVPIAAALREAKSRGLKHVVTGDGLDGLLFRGSFSENDAPFGLAKVLSRSSVLLGEALGVKVIQPFLQPKLVQACKSLIHTCGLRSPSSEFMRSILREAFHEVSAACKKKAFNEVDSGMFYVSDYFSSAISASVFESKAKHIFCKEGVCIRDAEHLVYYRAFRKVFKGKAPKNMVRWASKPCSACGYQLSTSMHWYCLVCGLRVNAQQTRTRVKQSGNAHSEKHCILEEISGRQRSSNVESAGEICKALEGSEQELPNVASSIASVERANAVSSQHDNSELHISNGAHLRSKASKSVLEKPTRRRRQAPMLPKENTPNFWALFGAGSAGLLLLLQLARR